MGLNMFGLTLVTGLPGASKTLNTIKMIVEDENHDSRPVFYNNIKLFFLDYDVCNSFYGYFYGVYKPSLKGVEAQNIQKLMERVHTEQRLVELSDVPHLEQLFDAWIYDGGFKLWLSWVRRVYPKKRLKALDEYLQINPQATFEQLKSLNLHWTRFDEPTLWYTLPRPFRLVIDECQRFFPPRGVNPKKPKHVEEFQTFRHSGCDVFLITQDPMLLDSDVRKLAVNHIHFVRNMGGSMIIRYYSGKGVQDFRDYFARRDSQKKTFKRDSNFYGLYHSADRHTYHFKVPAKLWFLGLGVLVLIGLIFFLFNSLFGSPDKQTIESSGVSSGVSAPAAAANISSGGSFVLPSSALSKVQHPLKDLCSSLSLAGFETIRSRGLSVRKYYLNCQTNEIVPVFASNDTEDDSNDTSESSVSEYKKRLLLDFQTLRELGYHLEFTELGNPILIFNGQKFLLMEV
jgi:zona occludens toxin